MTLVAVAAAAFLQGCAVFDCCPCGHCAKSCDMPEHLCVLGPGSDMKIHIAAVSLPINVALAGSSMRIGANGAASTCAVENFTPFNILGIGVVCVTPGTACPDGSRFCGPGAPGAGPSQGVQIASDGSIGACAGNTNCASLCDTQCASAPSFKRLASGCTDYCTGTAPADMVCSSDAQCAAAGNGTCNGKDDPSLTHANICQCSCVNHATGGSDPGDLRCNLGADVRIESGPPCDRVDVLVDLGNRCMPLSTQQAQAKIVDANDIPGSTVPPINSLCPGGDCNSGFGTAVSCAALDGSVTSGLSAVGVSNVFSTTLGDVSLGLRATCE